MLQFFHIIFFMESGVAACRFKYVIAVLRPLGVLLPYVNVLLSDLSIFLPIHT